MHQGKKHRVRPRLLQSPLRLLLQATSPVLQARDSSSSSPEDGVHSSPLPSDCQEEAPPEAVHELRPDAAVEPSLAEDSEAGRKPAEFVRRKQMDRSWMCGPSCRMTPRMNTDDDAVGFQMTCLIASHKTRQCTKSVECQCCWWGPLGGSAHAQGMDGPGRCYDQQTGPQRGLARGAGSSPGRHFADHDSVRCSPAEYATPR